jgi:hypothetical protein
MVMEDEPHMVEDLLKIPELDDASVGTNRFEK